jgi:hypothetical protein
VDEAPVPGTRTSDPPLLSGEPYREIRLPRWDAIRPGGYDLRVCAQCEIVAGDAASALASSGPCAILQLHYRSVLTVSLLVIITSRGQSLSVRDASAFSEMAATSSLSFVCFNIAVGKTFALNFVASAPSLG